MKIIKVNYEQNIYQKDNSIKTYVAEEDIFLPGGGSSSQH